MLFKNYLELGEISGNALLAQNMIIALRIMEQDTGMYFPYAVLEHLDFRRHFFFLFVLCTRRVGDMRSRLSFSRWDTAACVCGRKHTYLPRPSFIFFVGRQTRDFFPRWTKGKTNRHFWILTKKFANSRSCNPANSYNNKNIEGIELL